MSKIEISNDTRIIRHRRCSLVWLSSSQILRG